MKVKRNVLGEHYKRELVTYIVHGVHIEAMQ